MVFLKLFIVFCSNLSVSRGLVGVPISEGTGVSSGKVTRGWEISFMSLSTSTRFSSELLSFFRSMEFEMFFMSLRLFLKSFRSDFILDALRSEVTCTLWVLVEVELVEDLLTRVVVVLLCEFVCNLFKKKG